MMRRSPPGFSCLLGLDQRRKRPLTDMTPEEETTEAGEAGREEEVITLRFSGSRERRPQHCTCDDGATLTPTLTAHQTAQLTGDNWRHT